jgi:hypothetical protein
LAEPGAALARDYRYYRYRAPDYYAYYGPPAYYEPYDYYDPGYYGPRGGVSFGIGID